MACLLLYYFHASGAVLIKRRPSKHPKAGRLMVFASTTMGSPRLGSPLGAATFALVLAHARGQVGAPSPPPPSPSPPAPAPPIVYGAVCRLQIRTSSLSSIANASSDPVETYDAPKCHDGIYDNACATTRENTEAHIELDQLPEGTTLQYVRIFNRVGVASLAENYEDRLGRYEVAVYNVADAAVPNAAETVACNEQAVAPATAGPFVHHCSRARQPTSGGCGYASWTRARSTWPRSSSSGPARASRRRRRRHPPGRRPRISRRRCPFHPGSRRHRRCHRLRRPCLLFLRSGWRPTVTATIERSSATCPRRRTLASSNATEAPSSPTRRPPTCPWAPIRTPSCSSSSAASMKA